MFGAAIDYWHLTGDPSYNNVTSQALLKQVGPDKDYQPPEQNFDLGNDDQCFWCLAAMDAAETNFPNPPAADDVQWLGLTQAVFNTQARLWDNGTCGGGLRWQKNNLVGGYAYKNAISNGCFSLLSARLAAYTGNMSYANWAETAYDWTSTIGVISPEFEVWDGTSTTDNCTSLTHIRWTYNAGVFLYASSVMWNITQQDIWKTRALSLWNASAEYFFTPDKVMTEICERVPPCDTDQLSFKGYLARWMSVAMRLAPFLQPQIMPYLVSSAEAAAQVCNGPDGITCGMRWNVSSYDGSYGVGQQMSALHAVQSLLTMDVAPPLTNTTGGTSKGNPGGGGRYDANPADQWRKITGADKAGAGIFTALVLGATLAGGG